MSDELTKKPEKRKRMKAQFIESDNPEADLAKAVFALRPSVGTAYLMESFGLIKGLDKGSMSNLLREEMERVNDGDLRQCEAMLYGQAVALQAVFTKFAMRASTQEYMPHVEASLRLALKAQSQCTRTLEVLAGIKAPSVVFAKQANISHGHQQVNNNAVAPSSACEQASINQSNELLSEDINATLDTRRTATTVGTDQAMAAVEK